MPRKNFFMVSNKIFEYKLKPKDLAVYICLLRHKGENATCFPSRSLIGEECCMDKKTVDSAIKNLSRKKLVTKIKRIRKDGSRTSNMYWVESLYEGKELGEEGIKKAPGSVTFP